MAEQDPAAQDTHGDGGVRRLDPRIQQSGAVDLLRLDHDLSAVAEKSAGA
jgi:hypothetical protein